MAEHTDKRHIFPFFDLPRELRDLIYVETLGTIHLRLSCDLGLCASGVPLSHLLVVSRQMQTELEQQSEKRIRIYIKDSANFAPLDATDEFYNNSIAAIKLPSQCYKINHLCLHLVLSEEDESSQQLDLVNRTASSMPLLKSLTLCIAIKIQAMTLNAAQWRLRLGQEGWTTIPHLGSLEVYDLGDNNMDHFADEPRGWMMFKFDGATGQLKDVDQTQLFRNVVWYLEMDVFEAIVHNHSARCVFQKILGHGMPAEHTDVSTDDFGMGRVRRKLDDGQYAMVEELVTDVLQVVRNVKKHELTPRSLRDGDELESCLWTAVRRVKQWAHVQADGFENTDV